MTNLSLETDVSPRVAGEHNCRLTPLVSFVMPVYNTASYLEEAVDSILCQSYENFELIAVNDGSTDGSGEILDRYEKADNRVRVLRQENKGMVAALNAGLAVARGKYIARVDSDDVSLPERLAKQVAFMESHPEIGVCGTRCGFFGDKGEFVGTVPPTDPELIKCRLLFLPTMSHTAVMMRNDLVQDHHLYYNPEVGQAEDYDLWTRFSRHTLLSNIPDVLMNIRMHSASTTRSFVGRQDKCLSLVHKQVLQSLGIEPSEEELDLHLALSVCNHERSLIYVDHAEKWLGKIAEANRRAGVYDAHLLAQVLGERWLLVCVFASELGMSRFSRFGKSKLFVGYGALTRYCYSLGLIRFLKSAWRHVFAGS